MSYSNEYVEALQKQVAELREALELYGTHADNCSGNWSSGCECGLDSLRLRNSQQLGNAK